MNGFSVNSQIILFQLQSIVAAVDHNVLELTTHSISEVTERLSATGSGHSLFWPEFTTQSLSEVTERLSATGSGHSLLCPEVTTRNISEVTERIFGPLMATVGYGLTQ